MKSLLCPLGGFFIERVKNYNAYNMDFQQYHDCYEIFLMLDGERYIFCNDVFYTLKKGDLLIINPFELHYGESRNSQFYERYVMNFYPDSFDCIFTPDEITSLTQRLSTRLIHLDDTQLETVCGYFKNAEEHSKDSSSISQKLLYANIAELINSISLITPSTKPQAQKNLPPEIISAIHYINSNYAENISLDKISSKVHISKYHFCRTFKNTTGATFLEYLHNVRLSNAHKLLITTDIPLSEIAKQAGFSSASHLSRMFGEEYGCTPKAIRKELSKQTMLTALAKNTM